MADDNTFFQQGRRIGIPGEASCQMNHLGDGSGSFGKIIPGSGVFLGKIAVIIL